MPRKGEISDRTGNQYIMKDGSVIKILKYSSWSNCDIQFEDETILKGINFTRISNKDIKNPNTPTAWGVGYQGQGTYTFATHWEAENRWRAMLRRCYSEKAIYRNPMYRGITVCEEWHNFQNFAQWHKQNWKPEYMNKFWDLEKDIILNENKIYSPETCAFVPQEVNKLFTKSQATRGRYPIGVIKIKNRFIAQCNIPGKRRHIGSYLTVEEAFHAYKQAKEAYIKEVADKWKDLIDPRVYEALYNYKVEITD